MEWNKEEECPVLRSESELNKIAFMTFDWLDYPNLSQADTVDHPQIDTEDLSILSFDTSHLPGGKVADNSLVTAQASVAGTMEDEADPAPVSTAAQGAKTLVPVDVYADNLPSLYGGFYLQLLQLLQLLYFILPWGSS